jgi:hypothetical protein
MDSLKECTELAKEVVKEAVYNLVNHSEVLQRAARSANDMRVALDILARETAGIIDLGPLEAAVVAKEDECKRMRDVHLNNKVALDRHKADLLDAHRVLHDTYTQIEQCSQVQLGKPQPIVVEVAGLVYPNVSSNLDIRKRPPLIAEDLMAGMGDKWDYLFAGLSTISTNTDS